MSFTCFFVIYSVSHRLTDRLQRSLADVGHIVGSRMPYGRERPRGGMTTLDYVDTRNTDTVDKYMVVGNSSAHIVKKIFIIAGSRGVAPYLVIYALGETL